MTSPDVVSSVPTMFNKVVRRPRRPATPQNRPFDIEVDVVQAAVSSVAFCL
jgi:hypothetical protein